MIASKIYLMMKNNFENSIKNKVEQFDGTPPENVWTGVSQKLKNNTMKNKSNNYSKIWTGVAITTVIILAVIFWKINSADKIENNSMPHRGIAQKIAKGGKGETAHDLFPTELVMAKKQGKGIMAYICMENCKFCTKFVNETLSKPEVHEYLEERFIQVVVDLRDKENAAFFKKHEIEVAPSSLFFSADGIFLDKSIGALGTENFMEIVEGVWQKIQKKSDNISSAHESVEIKTLNKNQAATDESYIYAVSYTHLTLPTKA